MDLFQSVVVICDIYADAQVYDQLTNSCIGGFIKQ